MVFFVSGWCRVTAPPTVLEGRSLSDQYQLSLRPTASAVACDSFVGAECSFLAHARVPTFLRSPTNLLDEGVVHLPVFSD